MIQNEHYASINTVKYTCFIMFILTFLYFIISLYFKEQLAFDTYQSLFLQINHYNSIDNNLNKSIL